MSCRRGYSGGLSTVLLVIFRQVSGSVLSDNRVAAPAARSKFPLYPALTRRANLIPPLRGLATAIRGICSASNLSSVATDFLSRRGEARSFFSGRSLHAAFNMVRGSRPWRTQ